MSKVYLLEDDKSICELVSCALESSGIRVKTFNTVRDFSAAMQEERPDLCLLDIMLPDGNGLDVLTDVTKTYGVPCIMLSALGQELDKVRGLNLGAQDYITKPFGIMELTARVNAALRLRTRRSSFRYESGGLKIDGDAATVVYDGETLSLNPKEFKLLCCLAENEGRVMPRDRLLMEVWGYDVGETRTVDNHIARLRKLGLSDCIHTVHGLGYKFEVKK